MAWCRFFVIFMNSNSPRYRPHGEVSDTRLRVFGQRSETVHGQLRRGSQYQ